MLLFQRQWLPPLQQFQLWLQHLEQQPELVLLQLPARRVELPELPQPAELQLLPWPWLLPSEPYQPCCKHPDYAYKHVCMEGDGQGRGGEGQVTGAGREALGWWGARGGRETGWWRASTPQQCHRVGGRLKGWGRGPQHLQHWH